MVKHASASMKQKIEISLSNGSFLTFFFKVRNKPLCVLCQTTISYFKASNLQRHFKACHSKIDVEYPLGSELRKSHFEKLKQQFTQQTKILSFQFGKSNERVTAASFDVSWNLARASKSYSDGELIKQCVYDCVKRLRPDDKGLHSDVKNLQLSRHTVERRIFDLSAEVQNQLSDTIQSCSYFSLAVDESTDIQDQAQLAIFLRCVSSSFEIPEELLDVISLKGRTTGAEIKTGIDETVERCSLPLNKMTALCTDGAPAMVGSKKGLLGLMRADEKYPEFWGIHCILHRENLVSKTLNMDHVMKTVLAIVNFIKTRALNHRIFKQLVLDNLQESDDCATHRQT